MTFEDLEKVCELMGHSLAHSYDGLLELDGAFIEELEETHKLPAKDKKYSVFWTKETGGSRFHPPDKDYVTVLESGTLEEAVCAALKEQFNWKLKGALESVYIDGYVDFLSESY